jgi:hypothetical protein
MLQFLLVGLGWEVGRSEGHRFEALWHPGIACGDRNILQEILKLFSERDPCEGSTHTKSLRFGLTRWIVGAPRRFSQRRNEGRVFTIQRLISQAAVRIVE